MSEENKSGESVLVAVTSSDTSVAALSRDLAQACSDLGLVRQDEVRTLCDNDIWSAVECPVAQDTDSSAPLQSKLQNALGSATDYALLPAHNRRKRLLVSDMDSTIIEQECLDELADFAGLKADISAVTERAMRGELDFETALTERVSKLKGLPLEALAQCYAEKISLMPGARTLTATMHHAGAYCLLVSGGFTYFTGKVAADAGFQAHKGNVLLDDGTQPTGEVGRPILGRAAKLEFLDQAAFANGITRQETLAMGDGANDLAMIEAAGLGLAVHAKPVVAEAAHAAINHTNLVSALFFQGYTEDEILWRG